MDIEQLELKARLKQLKRNLSIVGSASEDFLLDANPNRSADSVGAEMRGMVGGIANNCSVS